jgi:Mor family transcriptional regulator
VNGVGELAYFIFEDEVQTDEQKVMINDILLEVQEAMNQEVQDQVT